MVAGLTIAAVNVNAQDAKPAKAATSCCKSGDKAACCKSGDKAACKKDAGTCTKKDATKK